MIRIDIETVKLSRRKKIIAGLESGVQKALYDAAIFGQNYAKKSILSGKKTGVIYGRGKKITRGKNKGKYKRYHQASAPGQAPANDFGNLANNIFAETDKKLTASLISRAPYSIYLEYGTYKMAARPFFRAAAWQAGLRLKEVLSVYTKIDAD